MTQESAAPLEGLRERHRKRTAADLEEAALSLFNERGFDAVTIDDIAGAADVSRRTFFRYFASKEDVVLSDHPKRLDENLQAALDRRPGDEPALTALRHAIMSLVGTYEDDRERLVRRFSLMTTTPALEARSLCLQRNWETSVTEMLAARMGVDPARDLRPGVVAATTMAAMRVATANWLAGGGQGDLPVIVAAALDLLDGGLQAAAAPPPARRRSPSTRPAAPARSRAH